MLKFAALAAVVLLAEAPVGRPDVRDLARLPNENDAAFASRLLKVPRDERVHTLAATWNGVPTIFADYVTGRGTETPERPLIALQRGSLGTYQKVLVTVGETEGGEPEVAAIGFANADRDPAKELIVILTWNQPHYGACGPVYEVRILDEPKPRKAALRQLAIGKHFGVGCERFRFTTVSAVKRELSRLGY